MQGNENFFTLSDEAYVRQWRRSRVSLPSSCNEHVVDVRLRVYTVKGWLDCDLLVIDNILCGQRTLTSRKDMLAASSAFKYYVCILSASHPIVDLYSQPFSGL
jgi:hypothetical protein